MDSYELDADRVIEWALNYADFGDLEKVAKSLYGVYVQRRKQKYPQNHAENRKKRRQITHTGEFRKPKKPKWQQRKARAERELAKNAQRFL